MVNEATAIRRARLFSPTHEQDDWLILQATAAELARRGCSVTFVEETEVASLAPSSLVVLNMCQGPSANLHLQQFENRHLFVNTPSSALGCLRDSLLPALERAGVPVPQSVVVRTSSPALPGEVARWGRVWVKRGDVHATAQGDVRQVAADEGAIRTALQALGKRHIGSAILQEHLHGPVIKFYGVRGNGFFRWYPSDGSAPFHLDEARVHEIAEMAAAAVGLDVYGGDAVITADRGPCAIDLNDWPTFARFRNEAAASIACHILQKAADDERA